MLVATISRLMRIGLVLSIVALLVAWPVLAQAPSGVPPRDELEIARNQLMVSGYSFEATTTDVAPSMLPVTGVSRAVLPAYRVAGAAVQANQWEAVAYELAASGVQFDLGMAEGSSPTVLPVTGVQFSPNMQLLEQYRQLYGGYSPQVGPSVQLPDRVYGPQVVPAAPD